jgi:hypothetical protein
MDIQTKWSALAQKFIFSIQWLDRASSLNLLKLNLIYLYDIFSAEFCRIKFES